MKNWKCPLCKDSLRSPVVTNCGHTFCWRCLSHYLETSDLCPVCKEKMTTFRPIFGQGLEDPDLDSLPPIPEKEELKKEAEQAHEENVEREEYHYQQPQHNENDPFEDDPFFGGNVGNGMANGVYFHAQPFGFTFTFGNGFRMYHPHNRNNNNRPRNVNRRPMDIINIISVAFIVISLLYQFFMYF